MSEDLGRHTNKERIEMKNKKENNEALVENKIEPETQAETKNENEYVVPQWWLDGPGRRNASWWD